MIFLLRAAPGNQALLDTSDTPNWPEHFVELANSAKDARLKRFYQTLPVGPDTPVSQVPFVALDFETTGMNPDQDAIISIGLVPFTQQRIQCKGSAHWIVNPNRPLNEESVVIHGITHSDLEQAPDLEVVLDQVLDALAGKIVVVHYKQIEREFLDRALRARLGEGIRFPVVDTLDIEAAIQHRACQGWFNRLRGKKPDSVRLGRARERYGLPAYQPHHALTDALATAELLQAQLAWHFSPDTTLGEIWQ
ncbi:Exonuclease RNase T and DNA polymerase III [Ferrimonas balearica DSM 9799]|uniref:Exonuclease RNase T and DNA polymerase III n=1 Tax=Ferrimonas balearica (strain DSM 9799 / CCM 4581 / KCTC 23876 / PAT) TaxID=550540 RepID=E1SS21_FERBD|nr:3'-5' exonuclease [Ferrimonas balearica]ADN75976.1 Exonuclease RNase T and DNA polymerase III [Ferrimonas balearica DSM 9799]MBY6223473.1 3'-5' exonuclease [Ferrimonas balearica]